MNHESRFMTTPSSNLSQDYSVHTHWIAWTSPRIWLAWSFQSISLDHPTLSFLFTVYRAYILIASKARKEKGSGQLWVGPGRTLRHVRLLSEEWQGLEQKDRERNDFKGTLVVGVEVTSAGGLHSISAVECDLRAIRNKNGRSAVTLSYRETLLTPRYCKGGEKRSDGRQFEFVWYGM